MKGWMNEKKSQHKGRNRREIGRVFVCVCSMGQQGEKTSLPALELSDRPLTAESGFRIGIMHVNANVHVVFCLAKHEYNGCWHSYSSWAPNLTTPSSTGSQLIKGTESKRVAAQLAACGCWMRLVFRRRRRRRSWAEMRIIIMIELVMVCAKVS